MGDVSLAVNIGVMNDPGYIPGARDKIQRGFVLVSSDYAELWVHKDLLKIKGALALMPLSKAQDCGLEDGCSD